MAARTHQDIAAAAQLACLLEVSAPKPGNVAPGVAFHDMRYEDFLASAVAIAPAFLDAGEQPVGETIRRAIADTVRVTGANTNLGIVLLFAPLAHAARADIPPALRDRVRAVLGATTIADAATVYGAIGLAQPGGLGEVGAEDVAAAPTVTLSAAMALAAGRDGIAREYQTAFEQTFTIGAPALRRSRAEGLDWSDSVVECYLALLAAEPDTLIARKLGADAANEVTQRARAVRRDGGVRTDAGRRALASFDVALRDSRNSRNPGTTADITAAAIFVVLLEGGWTGGWER